MIWLCAVGAVTPGFCFIALLLVLFVMQDEPYLVIAGLHDHEV